MKAVVLGVSLLALLGGASHVGAKEVDLAAVANAAVQMDPTLAVPQGVTLREIFRLHNADLNAHVTLPFMPDRWDTVGWRKEGSLGFISATPFANSTLIRECWGPSPYDSFSSTDMNCEGQNVPPGQGPMGYISTVQIDGTVPLYRCVYKWKGKQWRHYDTFQANCEGNAAATNDGPVGYVFL